MADSTIISIFLFLTIFVQRSTGFSWVVEANNDTESQTSVSSASPGFIPVSNFGGIDSISTDASSASAGFSLPTQNNHISSSSSTVTPSGPGGGGATTTTTTSTEVVVTGTQTFSAIFVTVTDTQSFTSDGNTASPTVTGGDAPASPPVTLTVSVTSPPQGVPPVNQLPSTITDSQLPTPVTSTFGNAVHVSDSAKETLSRSTTVFTTTSFSIFTSDGHIRSTGIPITSTSVAFVPVVSHSAQVTSQSSGPGTSVAVGIALGAVAIFLVLVLCFIINRRRHLRNRAFLRLGEEF
ncbi:hypothetical protein B0H13DRAFT_252467 [Mycena leptocephala]|nr:hypothetical protein B0H13DRAFT_252467 [Mycena leptocephala]